MVNYQGVGVVEEDKGGRGRGVISSNEGDLTWGTEDPIQYQDDVL